MIKLTPREMKKISRILTTVLFCAPVGFAYASTIATTSGSNLTAFHASNVNNNQWATLSNGRYDANTNVKADFGNCNSIVLRCAQPKCANGGCADISIASSIVNGCVQSNEVCKKYGDDLVNYMSAQLVASSNVKIKEQELAAQQAAAAASSAESQQQMAAMQQQMQQMQQQMVQQQQESAQQLQQALAQQQAQSQAALEEMKSAATNAAKQDEAGLSAYQQEAISRGITEDVLERQTMVGQIRTEIEDAETSMTTLKKTLQNVFDYAKCDSRGNNCEGPKRVKKWRELAKEFIDPYDNVIGKIDNALQDAQMLGVDLSQIYMMLDNSCSSWAQYMCPQMSGGTIIYSDVSAGQKGVPYVCQVSPAGTKAEDRTGYEKCEAQCDAKTTLEDRKQCLKDRNCYSYCSRCTMLKVLSGENAVYEGWINAEGSTDEGNTTVVACASGMLDSSKFFARRAKRRNGADLVDIEDLDTWLSQVEPSYVKKDADVKNDIIAKHCGTEDTETLKKSALSKTVPVKGTKFCVDKLGDETENKEECPFIHPLYAICDTHPYNAKLEKIDGNTTASLTEQTSKTKEIIGLKTTVISQQMYKQYEYLNATLRRLKIQLEKAIVKTNLEAAGAKSTDDSSSSGGLLGGGSSKSSQYQNCSGKDIQEAIYCLRSNYSTLEGEINKKKCNAGIKKQLASDLKILSGKIPKNDQLYTQVSEVCKDSGTIKSCETCLEEFSNGLNTLDDVRLDKEARRQGRYKD